MSEPEMVSKDAFLAMVVLEAQQRRLEALPSLEEMNQQFDPTPSFQDRVDRTLRKTKFGEKLKQGLKHCRRGLVAGMACITLLSGSLMQVHAVQEIVVDTLLKWKDQYVDVFFLSGQGTHDPIESVVLEYIPEGYELTQEPFQATEYYFAQYENEDQERLLISIEPQDDENATAIDNEQTDFYAIELDGMDVLWCVTGDNRNTVIWENNGLSCKLSSSMDLRELLEIAEKIKITQS